MQRLQQERIETLGLPVLWHVSLDDVPTGPSIVIANEFFDALPVYQAVKRADGWHERIIEISPTGDLTFGVASDPLPHFCTMLPRGLRQSPDDSIYEWRSDRVPLELGRRVRTDGAAIEAMKHPERSPYAFLGPPRARYGADAYFLQDPILRPARAGEHMSLEGPLEWRSDQAGFCEEVKVLARNFGYE